VVQKVVGADGKVVIDESTNPGEQALTTDVADCEANLLTHVVTEGTGTAAAVGGQEIFGKTGTTDNTTDAWFIGANAPGGGMQLATAVWFGNRTGNIGGAGFGGDSAAPVFRSFMSQALDGQAAGSMPDPGPVCSRPGGSVNQDGGRNNTPAPVVPVVPQLPTVQPVPVAPTPTAPPATTPTTPAATTPAATPRQNADAGQ
jgi:penicillin-binding protein 1A